MSKKKRFFSSEKFYEDIYICGYEDTPEEKIAAAFRNKDVAHYRMKSIFSGDILECEIYPVWNTKNKQRAKKAKESRAVQKNLNEKNAIKKLMRLVNTNFTSDHIWATVTYSNDKLPKSKIDAAKDIKNYMRRLNHHAKRNGLEPLKFVYVTEWEEDPKKKKIRCHHHVITNFADRDKAEVLWYGGARTNTRRLQPDEYGFEGLARYISKNPRGSKRFVYSKNLVKPTIILAKNKISKRKAHMIAENEATAPDVFSKLYEGYTFNDIQAHFAGENEGLYGGTYIYVRMHKKASSTKRKPFEDKNNE